MHASRLSTERTQCRMLDVHLWVKLYLQISFNCKDILNFRLRVILLVMCPALQFFHGRVSWLLLLSNVYFQPFVDLVRNIWCRINTRHNTDQRLTLGQTHNGHLWQATHKENFKLNSVELNIIGTETSIKIVLGDFET